MLAPIYLLQFFLFSNNINITQIIIILLGMPIIILGMPICRFESKCKSLKIEISRQTLCRSFRITILYFASRNI